MRQAAWLIEWPADDHLPVRYWHPRTGFMIDPNKAIWFAREQDANDMAKRDGLSGYALRSAEHIFGLSPAPGEGEAPDGPLRLRMHTEPAGDPTWMHLWFTRAPTAEERLGVAKAFVAHLADSNATDKPDTNT